MARATREIAAGRGTALDPDGVDAFMTLRHAALAPGAARAA